MWRSRRKSSREIDSIDGLIRRSSSSKVNFIHSSFKDVENLFANDENGFNETLAQPSPPCSTASRRLSIFHRVHLANKFARAFSAKQTPSPESDRQINIPAKSQPESNNDAAAVAVEKLTKSDSLIPIPAKSPPESNNDAAEEELTKSDRLISIPGAEKRVVVYTTSLRVVRSTFEACRTVQSILRGFRVSIDERDLSMDSRFLDELQNIMADCDGEDSPEKSEKTKLTLPRVFIGGRYIGGAEEVRQLHESGELKKFVEGLPAVSSAVCDGCGGVRFILCDECSGSHKCYTEKGGFRSCTLCNENGLVWCPSCLAQFGNQGVDTLGKATTILCGICSLIFRVFAFSLPLIARRSIYYLIIRHGWKLFPHSLACTPIAIYGYQVKVFPFCKDKMKKGEESYHIVR